MTRQATFALGALLLTAVGCREDAWSPTDPSSTDQPNVTAAAALVFRQVSAGTTHTCGVTTDNRVFCWVENAGRALGDGTTVLRRRPTSVAGTLRFRQVSAGFELTCGVTTDDLAYCWGINSQGQLGIGTDTGPETCTVRFVVVACSTRPSPVAGGRRFRQMSTSGSGGFVCGVTTPGNRAFCWGNGLAIGGGTVTRSSSPVAVVGGLLFRQVSAGSQHTCGVTTEDLAFCWGGNALGQLGDDRQEFETSQPVPVAGSHRFRQLDAGRFHTCAMTIADRAFCWGDGREGEIGDGKVFLRFTPRRVAGGLSFTRVTAGGGGRVRGGHSCGETAANLVYCWGANSKGQVGDGTTSSRLAPVPVSGSISFSQVSAGGSHTCGVTPEGKAYCWGLNRGGQLGDGTFAKRLVPVPGGGLDLVEEACFWTFGLTGALATVSPSCIRATRPRAQPPEVGRTSESISGSRPHRASYPPGCLRTAVS